MGEKQPVTQGEDVSVTPQDIYDSEYGGLVTARQKIFPTERRDIIVAQWIQEEKADFLERTDREWSYYTADSNIKLQAYSTIVHMVGIRVLRKAQNSRIDITDTDYSREIADLNKKIERKILNFESQDSTISTSNVEPDLVDPDSDYDYS